MGFEFKTNDLREAEKLQKAGGHLITIKGSEIPFEPKTYIFEEHIAIAKKMLEGKEDVVEVEEVKDEIEDEVVDKEIIVDKKSKSKKKGKGGEK